MLRKLTTGSLVALLLGAASPAFAGRGTQIDAPISGSGACTLGSATCSNYVDISASGVFQRAYIYSGGIVSIDGLLATNFDPSNPATWGGAIWFTPGYTPGTTYQVNAYFDSGFGDQPPSWGFNFFTLGSPVVDPDTDSALYPQMQVQLGAGAGTIDPEDLDSGWVGAEAGLAYLTGFDPPADAWIGVSWGSESLTQLVRNSNGLLVGPLSTDSDFVSTATFNAEGSVTAATPFTLRYATVSGAVPEPATWAMMLMGFAAVGMALRRTPRHGVALA